MSRRVHSQGNVPFSWENKPGECKTPTKSDHRHSSPPNKLPPPPCPPENKPKASLHDMQIPLPPCGFQPPRRSLSRKGTKETDDPFLIAYKEVTKSTRKGKVDQDVGFKNMSIFSCKSASDGMTTDSIFRVSKIPISRSHREQSHT